MAETGWTDTRPKSPHLQVWRWHVTMLGSIFHRASGVANVFGLILIVSWLFAAALGPEAYATYSGLFANPLSQVILFGFTVSVLYHLLNGVRHLFLDAGIGFETSTASNTAMAAIVLAVLGAVAIWLVTDLVPGVSIGGGA